MAFIDCIKEELNLIDRKLVASIELDRLPAHITDEWIYDYDADNGSDEESDSDSGTIDLSDSDSDTSILEIDDDTGTDQNLNERSSADAIGDQFLVTGKMVQVNRDITSHGSILYVNEMNASHDLQDRSFGNDIAQDIIDDIRRISDYVTEDRRKRLKSNEDEKRKEIHPKNSFNRFSDDLSELILSHLYFEDKFRFECLSKRTQRLIYGKQKELTIYCSEQSKKLLTEVRCQDSQSRLYFKINQERLTKVLAKMTKLETIKFRYHRNGFASKILVNHEDIKLIADHCPSLKNLLSDHNYIDMSAVSKESVSYLGQKLGRSIESLEVCDRSKVLFHLLEYTPNLRRLDVDVLATLTSSGQTVWPDLHKLNQFSISWGRLKRFPQDFVLPSVKKMRFKLSLKYANVSETISCFKSFPNLKSLNLIVLEADNRKVSHVEEAVKHLTQVCNGLEKLNIIFRVPMTNVLALIGTMHNLQTLSVTFDVNSRHNGGTPSFKRDLTMICWDSVKDLQRLTKLRTLRYDCSYASDHFLTDISKYLPQIESLILYNSHFLFYEKQSIRPEMYQQLWRLTRLKYIEIQVSNKMFFIANTAIRLKENCPQLKQIVVKDVTNTKTVTVKVNHQMDSLENKRIRFL